VGFGIPKAVTFDEMDGGDFVVGSGGVVYDRHRSAPGNGHPDSTGKNGFVNGTQKVSNANGVTTLSFDRELTPPGRNPISVAKAFRILWAFGTATPGNDFNGVQYHGSNRGSIMVDLSTKGNCDAATLALFPKPATNQTATNQTATNQTQGKGKGGKTAKKGGKKGKACPTGQTMCTAVLQKNGMKCTIGKCFKTPADCQAGAIKCTAALQAQGANCVVGMCFTAPPVMACPNGLIMCSAAWQAQGANCVVGMCFAAPMTSMPMGSTTTMDARPPAIATMLCPPRQTLCTKALQARGLNCILNLCVNDPDATMGSCPAGQVICTAVVQRTVNCILNACIDYRLTFAASGPGR